MHKSIVVTIVTGSAATLLAAGGAGAQEQDPALAVRAPSNNVLRVFTPKVHSLPAFCVIAGENASASCDIEGSARIKVSAATRKKLRLPSTTLASTQESVPCGQATCFQAKASKAVRDRLKRFTSVPVTYELKLTSPVRETITEKATMVVQASSGKLPRGAKQLLLRSSGDTVNFGRG